MTLGKYDKTAIRAGKVEIRRVFLEQWDPIGVRDEPNAQDEYDSYLGGMYDLLSRDALEAEVAAYLHGIETDRMGLDQMGLASDKERLSAVANALRGLNISLPRVA